MEDRKRRFQSKEHLLPEIQSRLRGLIQAIPRIGVHVFSESRDIADDWGLHLVVLPPSVPFSKGPNPLATKEALNILEKKGEQPRIKRNRLLFLAADAEATARLDDLVCTFKAWDSITKDVQERALNLDTYQSTQAQRSRDSASEAANRSIRETYRWLLAPLEEPDGRGGIQPMRWEPFALNTSSTSFSQEIERVLKENELVIDGWAPVHLDSLLRAWFWKDGVTDVNALDVWQKTCQFLYMPRLKDSNVFSAAVAEGAASEDFFGIAQGKREGKYQAFTFGVRTMIHLDSNLLIEPAAAASYDKERKQALPAPVLQPGVPGPQPSSRTASKTVTPLGDPKPRGSVRKRFYSTATLDPLLAKKQFADIVDEVIQQFTTRVEGTIKITVEIQAQSEAGFDEAVQRTVRENCDALKFSTYDFEVDE